MSKEDGTSINQFVATGVAEKVAALAARFFQDRKARADFIAFDSDPEEARRRSAPGRG